MPVCLKRCKEAEYPLEILSADESRPAPFSNWERLREVWKKRWLHESMEKEIIPNRTRLKIRFHDSTISSQKPNLNLSNIFSWRLSGTLRSPIPLQSSFRFPPRPYAVHKFLHNPLIVTRRIRHRPLPQPPQPTHPLPLHLDLQVPTEHI